MEEFNSEIFYVIFDFNSVLVGWCWLLIFVNGKEIKVVRG